MSAAPYIYHLAELTFLNCRTFYPACSDRTAYIHGLDFCSGDFVVIMDADFSHHVRPSPIYMLSFITKTIRSFNYRLVYFSAEVHP
jgi:glycosyltransferase involved in cell wall biosynthesis